MLKSNSPSSQQHFEPSQGNVAERILSLIVTGRRCQRELQGALQPLPLTDSQLLVLWMVQQLSPQKGGPGVGQSELVRALGISAAQISGLVDQLRRSGDLIGARAEQDRRQQRWQLTDAGTAKLTEALSVVSEMRDSLLSELAIANTPQTEKLSESPDLPSSAPVDCQEAA